MNYFVELSTLLYHVYWSFSCKVAKQLLVMVVVIICIVKVLVCTLGCGAWKCRQLVLESTTGGKWYRGNKRMVVSCAIIVRRRSINEIISQVLWSLWLSARGVCHVSTSWSDCNSPSEPSDVLRNTSQLCSSWSAVVCIHRQLIDKYGPVGPPLLR